MFRSAASRRGSVADTSRYLWLALALLAPAAISASASSAAAHAVLLATEPADGSVQESAPGEIVLRFNEPVAPVFVRVIGPDGTTLESPHAVSAIDTELRLPLPPGLIEGGYLVSYRVVSADSHAVGGSFAFTAGTTAAKAPQLDGTAAREALWQAAKVFLRFVQNIALMLAAGGALFRILVLRGGDRVRGLEAMVTSSAAVAILAAVLGIGVQGGLLAVAPASALGDPETWRLGGSATVGMATLVMVPALALVAVATAASSRPLGRLGAALGGLVAASGLALTGHSAASGWAAQTALALHAVALAYWLGALWPLHTIVRERPPDESAILVRRFSAIGVPAVALLVVAGVGTALTRIDDPAALVGTDYGRILLLKLAFVVALLAIAVTNRRRLMPALAASPKAPAALARNIRLELALAGATLLATAVLAHTPPPYDPADHDRHEQAHDLAPGFAVVSVRGGRTLLVEIAPARLGANALTLWLSDADGQPLAPLEVTVALSLPAAGIEPLVRVPESAGRGHYALARVDLPTAGRWSVRVEALISDFEKVIFVTEVPIR